MITIPFPRLNEIFSVMKFWDGGGRWVRETLPGDSTAHWISGKFWSNWVNLVVLVEWYLTTPLDQFIICWKGQVLVPSVADPEGLADTVMVPIQFDYRLWSPSNKDINVRYWETLNSPLAECLDPPTWCGPSSQMSGSAIVYHASVWAHDITANKRQARMNENRN